MHNGRGCPAEPKEEDVEEKEERGEDVERRGEGERAGAVAKELPDFRRVDEAASAGGLGDGDEGGFAAVVGVGDGLRRERQPGGRQGARAIGEEEDGEDRFRGGEGNGDGEAVGGGPGERNRFRDGAAGARAEQAEQRRRGQSRNGVGGGVEVEVEGGFGEARDKHGAGGKGGVWRGDVAGDGGVEFGDVRPGGEGTGEGAVGFAREGEGAAGADGAEGKEGRGGFVGGLYVCQHPD